jgi:hypothetical protein
VSTVDYRSDVHKAGELFINRTSITKNHVHNLLQRYPPMSFVDVVTIVGDVISDALPIVEKMRAVNETKYMNFIMI